MNDLTRQLVDFALNHLVAQKFMDGYRSYFAGASFILGGLVLLANMLAAGQYDRGSVEAAVAAFGIGYGIIGAAGKADKLIAAVKQGTNVAVVGVAKSETLIDGVREQTAVAAAALDAPRAQ